MASSSDGVDCSQNCTSDPWGFVGSISNAFDLVAVHGTSPGGEAFMPVWGYQTNFCGDHGIATTDAGGNPIRSWATCTPDPFLFCDGIQDSDEGDFDPPSCDNSEGCGNNVCTSDFTSAWPYQDSSLSCKLFGPTDGDHDPSRIDFPNNVSVYRAPILWENHSDEGLDDDYTFNMHSPGGELYDTQDGPRVHVEFDSDETIDHFIPNFDSSKCFTNGSTLPNPPPGDSFGTANLWWRKLRCLVDQSPGNDEQADRDIRCFLKQIVTPTLTCPQPDGVDPIGPDPMGVVVGVPSMDCGDHPHGNTAEIHPAYAMAIRIQEDPSQPEQWAFFYRRRGDNGECGSKTYRRCQTTFQLPLSLPVVPAGQVLKSADVQVDSHPWAIDDSSASDVTVEGHFDLDNGTVLTVTLPGEDEGVVGLVTVTPVLDTAAPQITCPGNISMPTDLGKCTAVATFAPTASDECSVSAGCSSPSGTAFPLGTTATTCTSTDQAGLSASCSFTVTVTAGNKCPLGVGYWKNHTDLWAVNSLTLGSVTYDKAQLISILHLPTPWDASVLLAKQLITALLNQANGSNPVPFCSTSAEATSTLGSCSVPCDIKLNSSMGLTMAKDAIGLELYNDGALTPRCAPRR